MRKNLLFNSLAALKVQGPIQWLVQSDRILWACITLLGGFVAKYPESHAMAAILAILICLIEIIRRVDRFILLAKYRASLMDDEALIKLTSQGVSRENLVARGLSIERVDGSGPRITKLPPRSDVEN